MSSSQSTAVRERFLEQLGRDHSRTLAHQVLVKLRHLAAGSLGSGEDAILEHVALCAEKRPEVFRDPEVFTFLTELLLNSKTSSVRRLPLDGKGGVGTSTLYVLAVRVLHRSLHAEKHWPLELMDVYLHDALGPRLWVGSKETALFCANLTSWTKDVRYAATPIAEPVHPAVEVCIKGGNNEEEDEGEEEVLEEGGDGTEIVSSVGTNAPVPTGTEALGAVFDRFENFRGKVVQKVLAAVLQRVDETGNIVFSGVAMGSTSRPVLQTLAAFSALPEIRLAASLSTAKLIGQIVFADDLKQLMTAIAEGMMQYYSATAYNVATLLPSDVQVAQNIVKLKNEMKPAQLDHFRSVLTIIACVSRHMAVLLVRSLLEEEILIGSGSVKIETIKIASALLRSVYSKFAVSRDSTDSGILSELLGDTFKELVLYRLFDYRCEHTSVDRHGIPPLQLQPSWDATRDAALIDGLLKMIRTVGYSKFDSVVFLKRLLLTPRETHELLTVTQISVFPIIRLNKELKAAPAASPPETLKNIAKIANAPSSTETSIAGVDRSNYVTPLYSLSDKEPTHLHPSQSRSDRDEEKSTFINIPLNPLDSLLHRKALSDIFWVYAEIIKMLQLLCAHELCLIDRALRNQDKESVRSKVLEATGHLETHAAIKPPGGFLSGTSLGARRVNLPGSSGATSVTQGANKIFKQTAKYPLSSSSVAVAPAFASDSDYSKLLRSESIDGSADSSDSTNDILNFKPKFIQMVLSIQEVALHWLLGVFSLVEPEHKFLQFSLMQSGRLTAYIHPANDDSAASAGPPGSGQKPSVPLGWFAARFNAGLQVIHRNLDVINPGSNSKTSADLADDHLRLWLEWLKVALCVNLSPHFRAAVDIDKAAAATLKDVGCVSETIIQDLVNIVQLLTAADYNNNLAVRFKKSAAAHHAEHRYESTCIAYLDLLEHLIIRGLRTSTLVGSSDQPGVPVHGVFVKNPIILATIINLSVATVLKSCEKLHPNLHPPLDLIAPKLLSESNCSEELVINDPERPLPTLPMLCIKTVYWKGLASCYLLVCAQPSNLGAFAWSHIPSVKSLMLATISGKMSSLQSDATGASTILTSGDKVGGATELEKSVVIDQISRGLQGTELLFGENAKNRSIVSKGENQFGLVRASIWKFERDDVSIYVGRNGIAVSDTSLSIAESAIRRLEHVICITLFSRGSNVSHSALMGKKKAKIQEGRVSDVQYTATTVSARPNKASACLQSTTVKGRESSEQSLRESEVSNALSSTSKSAPSTRRKRKVVDAANWEADGLGNAQISKLLKKTYENEASVSLDSESAAASSGFNVLKAEADIEMLPTVPVNSPTITELSLLEPSKSSSSSSSAAAAPAPGSSEDPDRLSVASDVSSSSDLRRSLRTRVQRFDMAQLLKEGAITFGDDIKRPGKKKKKGKKKKTSKTKSIDGKLRAPNNEGRLKRKRKNLDLDRNGKASAATIAEEPSVALLGEALVTQFGVDLEKLNDPNESEYMVLCARDVPRQAPPQLLNQLSNLSTKFGFGAALRNCKSPDFIAKSITRRGTEIGFHAAPKSACNNEFSAKIPDHGYGMIDRDQVERSADWLLPTISIHPEVVKRIPALGALYLLLRVARDTIATLCEYCIYETLPQVYNEQAWDELRSLSVYKANISQILLLGSFVTNNLSVLSSDDRNGPEEFNHLVIQGLCYELSSRCLDRCRAAKFVVSVLPQIALFRSWQTVDSSASLDYVGSLLCEESINLFMVLCEDMFRKGLDWGDYMKVLWEMNIPQSLSIYSNILRSLTNAMALDRHLDSRFRVLKFMWSLRDNYLSDDNFITMMHAHVYCCIIQALNGGSAAYQMVLSDSEDLVCETKRVISQLLQSIVSREPFLDIISVNSNAFSGSEFCILLPEKGSQCCLNIPIEVFRAIVTFALHQIVENSEISDFKWEDILAVLQVLIRQSSFKLLQEQMGAQLLDLVSFLDTNAISELCSAGSVDFLMFLLANTHELLLDHFIACIRALFVELELSKKANFNSSKFKQSLLGNNIEQDDARLMLALCIEACLLWASQNDTSSSFISERERVQETTYELLLCLVALSLLIAEVDSEMIAVVPKDLPWSLSSDVSIHQLKGCCETMRDSLWNVKHKRSPLETEFLLLDLYNLRVSENKAPSTGYQSHYEEPCAPVESSVDPIASALLELGESACFSVDLGTGALELLAKCKAYIQLCKSPSLDCKKCRQCVEAFRRSVLDKLSNNNRFQLLYRILFDASESSSDCVSVCPTALSMMSRYMFDAALYAFDVAPERLLLHLFAITLIPSLTELTGSVESLSRLDSIVAAYTTFLDTLKHLSPQLWNADKRRLIIDADRVIYDRCWGDGEGNSAYKSTIGPNSDAVSTMYEKLCEVIAKDDEISARLTCGYWIVQSELTSRSSNAYKGTGKAGCSVFQEVFLSGMQRIARISYYRHTESVSEGLCATFGAEKRIETDLYPSDRNRLYEWLAPTSPASTLHPGSSWEDEVLAVSDFARRVSVSLDGLIVPGRSALLSRCQEAEDSLRGLSGQVEAEAFILSLPSRYPVLWESLGPYCAAIAKAFVDLIAPRQVLAFLHIPPLAQFLELRGKHGNRWRALVKELQRSMLDSAAELAHQALGLDELTSPSRSARLFDSLGCSTAGGHVDNDEEELYVYVERGHPAPALGDTTGAIAERRRLRVWIGALSLIDVTRRCEATETRPVWKESNAASAGAREGMDVVY